MKDFITLEATKIPTFLGLAAIERQKFQWADFYFQLGFNSKKAASSGQLSDCIDYVRILGEAKFILWFSRFYLIETALETMAQYILQTTVAEEVIVKASKPAALGEFAKPSLTIRRDLKDYPLSSAICDIQNTDIRLVRQQVHSQTFIGALQNSSAALAVNYLDKSGQIFLPQNSHNISDSDLGEFLFLKCLDPEYRFDSLAHYPYPDRKNRSIEEVSFYNDVLSTYVARNQ